jgi:hypothetical protein
MLWIFLIKSNWKYWQNVFLSNFVTLDLIDSKLCLKWSYKMLTKYVFDCTGCIIDFINKNFWQKSFALITWSFCIQYKNCSFIESREKWQNVYFTYRRIDALCIDKSTNAFDKKVLLWSYGHFAYNQIIVALTRAEKISKTFSAILKNLNSLVDICERWWAKVFPCIF